MKKIADRYISHTGENLWNFEVILDSEVENINHIHPLKLNGIAIIVFLKKYWDDTLYIRAEMGYKLQEAAP